VPIETFDIWDQALLTDVITRPSPNAPGIGDESDLLGNKLAPLVPHAGRLAKIRVTELRPFGRAQFRAPDATPPLFKPPGETYREEIVELKLIDEMERIMEEDWMKLNSSDENIRRSAGRSIIERGQILQLRNERATEWMRWQAFNGELVVPYNTGASIYINYGLPAGHRPTAGTLWSVTADADPIEDIAAWSEKLADDSGFYGKYLHMNTKTYDYLIRNQKIKNMINFYAPGASNVLRPRREDITNIMTSFSQDIEIVIYDNGFRDVGTPTGPGNYGRSSLTKYLPDGKVLLTTDYVLDGVRIADTLDGQVTVSAGYNNVTIQQGFQAEVMLDHISKTHFLRAASARIPRIIIPEAFLWATVA
jgi:hypothetical protein